MASTIEKEKRKMQQSKNKTVLSIAIIVILLFSSVIFLVNLAVPAAQAQVSTTQPTVAIPSGATPYTVDDAVFLSFVPHTVGIGQTVLINAWVGPSPAVDRYMLASRSP
jgi:hypothetical protein